MFEAVNIGSLRLDVPLVLSPMSGITCSAFRRLIRRLNGKFLGLVVTEFVSVEAVTRKIPKTLQMMRYRPEEKPLGIQLFGRDPEKLGLAALMVEEMGADLVEINCGCPAPKVVRKGGGCHLMTEPEHLRSILRTVRKKTSLPLTVKMRSGFDAARKNAEEIAKIAEDEGADAVIVHGRTRVQHYSGEADWEIINKVALSLKIPVFGNGDVIGRGTAEEKVFGVSNGSEGHVKGLYIGRGSLANPFIFEEIMTGVKRDLRGNEPLVLEILRDYSELLLEDMPEKACGGRLKQLASAMCRGLSWRKEFMQLPSFEAIVSFIKERATDSQKQLGVESNA